MIPGEHEEAYLDAGATQDAGDEDADPDPRDRRMNRHPRHFGRELAEHWGLDPNVVAQIEIVIGPNDFPYANVTLYVDQKTERMLLDLEVRHIDGGGAND